jgi:hypothetical protein
MAKEMGLNEICCMMLEKNRAVVVGVMISLQAGRLGV